MEVLFGILIPFIGTALGSACVFFMKITRRFGTACACRLCRRSDGGSVDLSLLIPAIEQSEDMGEAVLPSRLYRILGRRAVLAPA